MPSLKDALKKAGLSSSKTQNDRENHRGQVKKASEKHQEHRNFCEVCELVQPDVERYKHRNPTVDAEWICSACADKEQIQDQFRVTHQSDFARAGRFRREFGATKDPNDFKKGKFGGQRNSRPDGNRTSSSKNRGSNRHHNKKKNDSFGNR